MKEQNPALLARRATPGSALIAPSTRYLPPPKLQLALADLGCVVVTTTAALAFLTPTELVPTGQLFVRIAAAVAAFAAAAYGCGLYDDDRLRKVKASLAPAVISVGVAFGSAMALGHPLDAAARFRWSAAVLAALLCILGVRVARAAAVRFGCLGHRCIIVGSAREAERVVALLDAHPHAEISVVGLVQPSGTWRPQEPVDGVPVLGTSASLEQTVRTQRASLVILATPPAYSDVPLMRALRAIRYAGVKVTDFTALHEELAREIPLDHLSDEWLFLASTANSRFHARFLKRAMDVAGAALLLVPASVIVAAAAIAIRVSSKGPVIFRQERLGQGGRPFMVLKLRTMYADAESRGAVWSCDGDPRITPVGRILRKFRIDELPQLVNALRGDMSLVGPRPELPVLTDKIVEQVPLFPERLMVRPGITGWAQVMAPYAASVEDSQRKLQFDLYYTKHMSAGLDLFIAAKTVRTMVFGRERSQNGLVAGNQLAGTPLPGAIAAAESRPHQTEASA